jgi:hypothetical protein
MNLLVVVVNVDQHKVIHNLDVLNILVVELNAVRLEMDIISIVGVFVNHVLNLILDVCNVHFQQPHNVLLAKLVTI